MVALPEVTQLGKCQHQVCLVLKPDTAIACPFSGPCMTSAMPPPQAGPSGHGAYHNSQQVWAAVRTLWLPRAQLGLGLCLGPRLCLPTWEMGGDAHS